MLKQRCSRSRTLQHWIKETNHTSCKLRSKETFPKVCNTSTNKRNDFHFLLLNYPRSQLHLHELVSKHRILHLITVLGDDLYAKAGIISMYHKSKLRYNSLGKFTRTWKNASVGREWTKCHYFKMRRDSQEFWCFPLCRYAANGAV